MLASTRQRFLDDYVKIRHAEGRGSQDAAYYLALPYRDVTGRLQDQWTIRGKSYRFLERRVLPSIERRIGRPLRVADLGAGNCWMSYRLALRGHRPVAIDILGDELDGLGGGPPLSGACAVRARERRVRFAAAGGPQPRSGDVQRVDPLLDGLPAHAERSAPLPAARGRIPDRRFAGVPAPEHGEAMRRERHQQFQKKYGFASDSLASIEYFDEEMLATLARDLGIAWTVYRPWYGWQWALRPWKARWKGQRPPSRFWILRGRFES